MSAIDTTFAKIDNSIHFFRLLNPNSLNTNSDMIIAKDNLSIKLNTTIGLSIIVETQSIALIIILDKFPIISIASIVPSFNVLT